MKKIALISSMLLASVSTGAMAGNFYIGPTIFYQHNSASHSSFSGVHPRLSLGYGTLYGEYYLAGEIFAVPFTGQLSSSTNNGALNAKTTHSFGASFIPGMSITDNVIGYLRLGVINSQFDGPNTSKTGGQAGIGFMTPISQSWDVRVEYIFTAYQSISGLGSVKANEIGLGFAYKFDSGTTSQPYKS